MYSPIKQLSGAPPQPQQELENNNENRHYSR